ncbi:hypothetical protein L1887_03218 [Cichorium endivia]|nr:hypothetical protein L1887_03218 [Cichorium endivia]
MEIDFAEDSMKNVIKVEEEIERDQIGTRNYCFSKIGEYVPNKCDADFNFDMESLPARPVAVSERFGVIFVVHSSDMERIKKRLMIGKGKRRKRSVYEWSDCYLAGALCPNTTDAEARTPEVAKVVIPPVATVNLNQDRWNSQQCTKSDDER